MNIEVNVYITRLSTGSVDWLDDGGTVTLPTGADRMHEWMQKVTVCFIVAKAIDGSLMVTVIQVKGEVGEYYRVLPLLVFLEFQLLLRAPNIALTAYRFTFRKKYFRDLVKLIQFTFVKYMYISTRGMVVFNYLYTINIYYFNNIEGTLSKYLCLPSISSQPFDLNLQIMHFYFFIVQLF